MVQVEKTYNPHIHKLYEARKCGQSKGGTKSQVDERVRRAREDVRKTS
jgi:hypothetical protein